LELVLKSNAPVHHDCILSVFSVDNLSVMSVVETNNVEVLELMNSSVAASEAADCSADVAASPTRNNRRPPSTTLLTGI
jgi:hypothetical protein